MFVVGVVVFLVFCFCLCFSFVYLFVVLFCSVFVCLFWGGFQDCTSNTDPELLSLINTRKLMVLLFVFPLKHLT